MLPEQFEVALENDFEEAIVASLIPSNIVGPHVDEYYIRHGQGKQRGGLFKRGSLFSSLLGVGSFDVEDQDLPVFTGTHPDTLCRLLSATSIVHHIELGPKQ